MSDVIQIIDTSLNNKGQVDSYDNWTVHLKHGQKSFSTVQLDPNANNADTLIKGNVLYDADKDNPFWITEQPTKFDSDKETKTAISYDIMWLLEGRIITSELTYSSKTVEYIVKDIIDKSVVNPTDSDRDLANISVESSTTLGSTINVTIAKGANLATTIEQLLAIDYLGIQATIGASTIEIDLYKGADRSQGNTESNSPVIFSLDYDNLQSGQTVDSNTKVKNVVYVGETLEKVGTATGYDRRELYVRSDSTDTTELQALGTSAQTTEEKGGTYDVVALSSDASFIYGTDYFLGDIVTVEGEDLRIVEVEIIKQTDTYEVINLTFGQPQKKLTNTTNNHEQRIQWLEVESSTSNLVDEYEFTSAASSYTFTGLDLNSDGGIYDILIYGASSVQSDYYLEYNGNSSSSSYRYARRLNIRSSTTSSGADGGGLSAIAGRASTAGFVAKHTVSLPDDYPQSINDFNADGGSSGSTYRGTIAQSYLSTQTNITSLKFAITSGNFNAGTIVKIYKRS